MQPSIKDCIRGRGEVTLQMGSHNVLQPCQSSFQNSPNAMKT